HGSGGARSLATAQRLTPDREEVAERKRSPYRRLDVNDPVIGVRVQPVKARARNDKGPLGALLDLPRLADSDAVRYGQRLTVGVNRDVGVDVECQALAAIAGDTVDGWIAHAGLRRALAICHH